MTRVLIIMLVLFLSACGDSNLLEGASNDDTNSAKNTELEIALQEKNYDYIINELEGGNYAAMDMTKRKLLVSAWLGKSGFSAVENLDMMVDSDVKVVKFLAEMQQDSNNIDRASVDAALPYYSKVMALYADDQANNANDKTMVTASGVASSMYIIMSTFGAIADSMGSFDVDALEDGDFNASMLTAAVTDIIANGNIDLLYNVSEIITDQEVKEKFLSFYEDLTGQRTPGGTVDATKLEEAIKKGLGIE